MNVPIQLSKNLFQVIFELTLEGFRIQFAKEYFFGDNVLRVIVTMPLSEPFAPLVYTHVFPIDDVTSAGEESIKKQIVWMADELKKKETDLKSQYNIK